MQNIECTPTIQNGKVLTYIACGSYRHLLNDCPDSWGNVSETKYIETDDGLTIENDPEAERVLFTVIMKTIIIVIKRS